MKTHFNAYQIVFILFSFAIITACSSSKSTTASVKSDSPQVVDTGYAQMDANSTLKGNTSVNPNENQKSNISLNQMMMRLPGVNVQGSGGNARITVSGSASFMSGTEPLFVLNGTVVGTDYSTIFNVVNPNDVTSLDVLKGPDAAIYGSRGANGVILIRTK